MHLIYVNLVFFASDIISNSDGTVVGIDGWLMIFPTNKVIECLKSVQYC